MGTYALKYRVSLLVATFVLSADASSVGQQASGPQGDSYASIAKLPDWSGVWVIPFESFRNEQARRRDPKDAMAPPLTPAYSAMQRAFIARASTGADWGSIERPRGNEGLCLPAGMPSVMRFAFAIEFLFTPGRVTMLAEQDSMIRRIYTDGRAHSEDPDFTYTGESIGRWENETLVVHTTAITPKAELLPGVRTSGKAQVTERIYLKDKNHLQIDTVVEDSTALTVPWRYSRVHERSDSGFFERVCLDNNRDINGGEPDLTPPKE